MDILKFLWKYMKPAANNFGIIIILSVFTTLLALVEPYLFKVVFDTLSDNFNQPALDYNLIFKKIGILVIFWSLIVLAQHGSDKLKNYYANANIAWSDKRMIIDVFNKILSLSLRYHKNQKSGELMDRLTRAQDKMYRLLESSFSHVVPAVLTILGALIIMMFTNVWFAVISLSTVPFFVLITLYLYPQIRTTQKTLNRLYEKYYGNAYDAVGAIEVVKSFNSEEYERKRLEEDAFEAQRLENLQGKRWNIIAFVQIFSAHVARIVVVFYGTMLALKGEISVGDVIMFVSLTSLIFQPLYELSYVYDSFYRGINAIRKVIKIINAKNEIIEKKTPLIPKRIKGQVEFRQMTFSYEERQILLKNISFVAQPGEMVALVGPSGVGKSTIGRLLGRFYDAVSGEIYIDGKNIKAYQIAYLRRNVGMVLQENTLFNDTIHTNIAYGRMEATREEIIVAAKAAYAHEFIVKLEKGYDTLVGERGVKLSGGEKQRVAIARALIKNPPILVLDEATSALDSESEQKVQAALFALIKNRTTIVIAHRLSTVMKANQILVFENGEIIERGNHQELLDNHSGLYKKLFEIQSGGYLG
jgi:ABC-type multidrug transport system fused ATPase/permease subunit